MGIVIATMGILLNNKNGFEHKKWTLQSTEMCFIGLYLEINNIYDLLGVAMTHYAGNQISGGVTSNEKIQLVWGLNQVVDRSDDSGYDKWSLHITGKPQFDDSFDISTETFQRHIYNICEELKGNEFMDKVNDVNDPNQFSCFIYDLIDYVNQTSNKLFPFVFSNDSMIQTNKFNELISNWTTNDPKGKEYLQKGQIGYKENTIDCTHFVNVIDKFYEKYIYSSALYCINIGYALRLRFSLLLDERYTKPNFVKKITFSRSRSITFSGLLSRRKCDNEETNGDETEKMTNIPTINEGNDILNSHKQILKDRTNLNECLWIILPLLEQCCIEIIALFFAKTHEYYIIAIDIYFCFLLYFSFQF